MEITPPAFQLTANWIYLNNKLNQYIMRSPPRHVFVIQLSGFKYKRLPCIRGTFVTWDSFQEDVLQHKAKSGLK